MSENEKGLCDRCQHRASSKANCEEAIRLGIGDGMICDPTPKYECKLHALYAGNPVDENKDCCNDFVAIVSVKQYTQLE